MRKTFLILSLVAVTLFTSASDVFAQRRGGGGRRGGVSVRVGGGYYGAPYYYGGRGYYYGSPYYSGSPYYYDSGYYYSPSYSYSTPTYVAPDTVVQAPPAEIRQSSYSDPSGATITVLVPAADAQVWFNDTATAQRGMERIFQTPSLQFSGTYTVRATWTENGRTMNQQRQVQVQPGQSVTVDFRGSPAERLPTPKS